MLHASGEVIPLSYGRWNEGVIKELWRSYVITSALDRNKLAIADFDLKFNI